MSSYSSSDNSDSDSDSDSDINNIKWTGRMLHDKYIVIQKLGSGAYATVWLIYNTKDTEYYALKIHNTTDYKAGVRELELLNKFNDGNVCIKLYDSFEYIIDSKTKYFCIVLELLAGSIYDISVSYPYNNTGLPITIIKQVIKTTLIALDSIHKKNYIHTDIKPENILVCGRSIKVMHAIKKFSKLKIKENIILSDTQIKTNSHKNDKMIIAEYIKKPTVKLADFGTCIDSTKPSFDIQTRYYRAPEIILQTACTNKCDIWSVGCLLYELLTGKILFHPSSTKLGSTDRHHIYLFQCCLGNIPQNIVNKSPIRDIFFRNDGIQKSIDFFDYTSINNLLQKNIKTKVSSIMFNNIVNFINLCLTYDINSRPDAYTLLNHEFINK
jgi:serine/threonine-protein kinase SRPK3